MLHCIYLTAIIFQIKNLHRKACKIQCILKDETSLSVSLFGLFFLDFLVYEFRYLSCIWAFPKDIFLWNFFVCLLLPVVCRFPQPLWARRWAWPPVSLPSLWLSHHLFLIHQSTAAASNQLFLPDFARLLCLSLVAVAMFQINFVFFCDAASLWVLPLWLIVLSLCFGKTSSAILDAISSSVHNSALGFLPASVLHHPGDPPPLDHLFTCTFSFVYTINWIKWFVLSC